ncbi:DUF2804 domain-containing protein [Agarivorans aestuarii]|uniref:DUF2804 domain-containing protein n=1 Tax=Agarivorans aestuarii TaxID=1563703 RepID=A0ABU7G9J2_9ALTE|nr:DUF2804 domain-containing protein [Agarivorans aestuarii]MEE1676077.1 DUF2804 domain-containing protein [Agarivorans aestuarii]
MHRSQALKSAPSSLVATNGELSFGHFSGPVSHLGLAHFVYTNTMDKPASAWAKHFHYKQFQFVSIKSDDYILGFALADIRYLGSGFCYAYHIASQSLQECTWLKPCGVGYGTKPSPVNSLAFIKGKHSLQLHISEGQWQLTANTPFLEADLQLAPANQQQCMAMCSPTGYSGWTYTQKHNALPVAGHLQINGKAQNLNSALGGYDFSAGYMRRETCWRWASLSARLNQTTIGLNLAAGVNETGCNENVLWINDHKQLLGPVHFIFKRSLANQRSDQPQVWHIYSEDGRVNLRFTPLNSRQERLNLLLLKSNFRQYIGHFSGSLIDELDQTHQLDQVLGLTEDHFARW